MDDAPDRRPRWGDQHALLLELARQDLAVEEAVRPTMIAFAGEEPLLVATLRPFPRGAHADAILEVGALVMALGADRLALSLSGMAWSTADPIPPVLPDVGDLRQPVVVIHEVDGTTRSGATASAVYPVEREADDVALGPPIDAPGAVGWVPEALAVIVAEAAHPTPRPQQDDDLARQVIRCRALGHDLAWGAGALARVRQALDSRSRTVPATAPARRPAG